MTCKMTADTEIIITEEPDAAVWEAIVSLTEQANAFDKTHYGIPEDADLYLLMYDRQNRTESTPAPLPVALLAAFRMGETIGGRPVTEVSAFTLPAWRGRGCFAALLRELRQEPEGQAVLRFPVYDVPAARAVLRKLQASFWQAELMMELPLETAGCMEQLRRREEDKEDAGDGIRIEALPDTPGTWYCHSTFSECFVQLADGQAYIYGVLTAEGARRGGQAWRLLRRVLAACIDHGAGRAFLQVSEANTAAVGLYRKLGFRTADRLEYWRI